MDLRDEYERYRQAFYNRLEQAVDADVISEDEYYEQLNDMLSYDDYVGDIIDRAYDDVVDRENGLG